MGKVTKILSDKEFDQLVTSEAVTLQAKNGGREASHRALECAQWYIGSAIKIDWCQD